jgi:hypothetical protein
MAGKFDQTNSHLGEGLSQITDNVAELGGSFKELGSTIGSIGSTGGASLTSLIPAFAGAVAAGMALYETYRMITGEAQKAEDASEAVAAAVGDLQSKLEALAEKGVTPGAFALTRFSEMTIEAQLAKSQLENLMERAKEIKAVYTDNQTQIREQRKELKELLDFRKKNITASDPRLVASLNREHELQRDIHDAIVERQKAQDQLSTFIREKALPAQQDLNKAMARAAKLEQELEEQSAESTLGRVNELRAKLEGLKVMKAENTLSDERLEIRKAEIEKEQALQAIELEGIKKNAPKLLALEKRLKAEAAQYDERAMLARRFELQEFEILEKSIEAEKEAEKAKHQEYKARLKKRLAEAHRIRLLEIENMKLNGAEQSVILEQRYQADLKLAQGNAKAKLAVDLRYQNQRLRLQQEADAKAEAERQKLEAHRRNFLLESQAFDISMMEDGIDKELSALELKYQRQREMKERSEEELTELTRRYNIERAAIFEKYDGQAMQALKESFMSLGEQLRSETGSMIFRQLTDESTEESRRQLEQTYREDVRRAKDSAAEVEGSYKERVAAVDKANREINDLTRTYQEERQKISEQEKSQLPNAIGQVLLALGEQAAVESLMFAAKAVAAGFAGSAKLAAGYGKASLIMAGAAVTAGITGKSLTSSGGGGGGGGGGGVSPLGTPQIAPEPEREQAESQQMVFNINFGGAVVYDTKQAAELALADRITSLQNINRRGAPRRRF